MKIALITDDGQSISRHFGRAQYYLVVTIEDGKPAAREMRAKLGHNHFSAEHGAEHEHAANERHGFDAASQNRHNRMAEAISDCQALICGGMGMGAYEGMKSLNIQPMVTDLQSIDEAVAAYLAGSLQDRTDMLH